MYDDQHPGGDNERKYYADLLGLELSPQDIIEINDVKREQYESQPPF